MENLESKNKILSGWAQQQTIGKQQIISELEDNKNTQSKHRENRLKTKNRASGTCGTIKKKRPNTHLRNKRKEPKKDTGTWDKLWLETSQICKRH